MATDQEKLSYEVYIAVPPNKVWEALTDGSITKHYFYGARVESKFVKGTPIAYLGDGDFRLLEGKILEAEPGKRLVTTFRALWDDSVTKDAPSRVSWEISPAGEATKLTITHDGFKNARASFEQSVGGWPVILSSLKTYLETGKALKIN